MNFSYPAVEYAKEPFPHAVIKGAWNDSLLDRCKAECSAFTDWDGNKDFKHARQKRFCGTFSKLPEAVKSVILEAHEPPFLRWLQTLTGEDALIPDPYLFGGGIHQIGAGGYLNIHTDFNWHRELRLYRRLNLLLYLNRGWEEAWGGHLVLSGTTDKSILPEANTMVVFTTDESSWHGHPNAMTCPPVVTRDSIALYYYSALKPKTGWTSEKPVTVYTK